MINNELTYWVALSNLPYWRIERLNNLLVKIIKEQNLSLEEFFLTDFINNKEIYELSDKEINDLQYAKEQLPNHAFLVEELLSQGYKIIPINSAEYPKTLKQNLKLKSSPPLIYVKGNTQIFNENSIAIVGSRDASQISLEFTDNIAKLASKEFKVVVSGFAKGVDKQALDSAIKYKGQSIIVLPQGIMTYTTGYNKYYKQIVNGDVLVLSTFHPKAVWSAGLAMARNPIIYGLANEIYVAESSDKGGTWSGVIDGLRKGRKIFVRYPELNEKNANLILIQKGALPVNFDGKVDESIQLTEQVDLQFETISKEYEINYEQLIIDAIKSNTLTLEEILKRAKLDWKKEKLRNYIKNIKNIYIEKKGRTNYYSLKKENSDTLFT